jgi:CheY-like chemotaxis protein
MCSVQSAQHTAFFYASEDASFAHVIDFLAARDGERVLVMTTMRRWEDIGARLQRAEINWALAVRRGNLVVADAVAILARTVREGLFERSRFDAELAVLMSDGHPPQRVYSEAASTLIAHRHFPAALALERAEQEIVERTGTRICCGFDLQQFPEAERDWQVRSVMNAHQDAAIAADAWTRPVVPDAGHRIAEEGELVLLWDDHEDTRIMYAEALTFSGYRVMTAADASQAFTLATAYRPHVLVFDLRLPARLAVTTMRRLRARPDFNAPILALTAHVFREERAGIVDEGFDVVLSKPCLPDTLVAAVARSLSRRRNG